MVARDSDQADDQFELTFALGREHRHHQFSSYIRQAKSVRSCANLASRMSECVVRVLVPCMIGKFSQRYFSLFGKSSRNSDRENGSRFNANGSPAVFWLCDRV
jgi:hypothetical protein